MGRTEWYDDGKARPLSFPAVYFHFASMLVYDPLDDGQAQSRPSGLRRNKGPEDTLSFCRRNPYAVIPEPKQNAA